MTWLRQYFRVFRALAVLTVALANSGASAERVDLNFINAVSAGDLSRVKTLLAAGADVNSEISTVTVLMRASWYGHTEVVRALLEAGAEVNATTNVYNNGRTALLGAAEEGRAEVVRALLEAGADVNATTDDGETALMLARRHRNRDYRELVRVLQKSAAEKDLVAEKYLVVDNYLVAEKDLVKDLFDYLPYWAIVSILLVLIFMVYYAFFHRPVEEYGNNVIKRTERNCRCPYQDCNYSKATVVDLSDSPALMHIAGRTNPFVGSEDTFLIYCPKCKRSTQVNAEQVSRLE